MKVAFDNCVASAGVMFAKKAGLPQLVAGSIRSQGVAFPPHSKFVVFTVPYISYLFRLVILRLSLRRLRRESDSRGMTTPRSCMQMVLSYFACRGCAWKLHLYLLYPVNPAICCCEQTKWQPPSVQLQPSVQVDVTQLSVVIWRTLVVPSFASMTAPS